MVLVLLLALPLCLVLPGCGGKSADEEKGTALSEREEDEGGEEVELGAEYVNEEWGYSLSYPEDWELEEILDGHGCSLTDPDHEEWEIEAWGDPDNGETPEEWLEAQYTMRSSFMDTEREDDTFTDGTFDGSDYVYDYWTVYVPAGDYYQYEDVFVAEGGGNIYFVTGEYPVDDVEEAEPIVAAVMDSLLIFSGEDMTEEDIEEDGEEVYLGAEYVNEEWGYSLDYPEGWELKEILSGHGCRITDPDHEEWEVQAWGDPDNGKTSEEWLEEQYNMMSSLMGAEREPDTLTTGTFDGADYAYDYWVRPASNMTTFETDRYYEIFVAASGGNIYFVTGEYPVDDVGEAESVVMAIMDSLALY